MYHRVMEMVWLAVSFGAGIKVTFFDGGPAYWAGAMAALALSYIHEFKAKGL